MKNTRDNAKQLATHDGASTITLTGGAAEAGFRTFVEAYEVTGMDTFGAFTQWDSVPVRVDKSDGAWGLYRATFEYNSVGPESRLTDLTAYQTSTGAPLTFAVGEVVTVAIVVSSFARNKMSMPMLAKGTNPNDNRSGGSYYPETTTDANFAIGLRASASGTHATAIGQDAVAAATGTPGGSVAWGIGATNYRHTSFLYGHQARAYSHMSKTLSAYNTAGGAGNNPHFFGNTSGVLNGGTNHASPVTIGYVPSGTTMVTGSDTLFCPRGVVVLTGFVTAVGATNNDRKVWRVEYIVTKNQDYVVVVAASTVAVAFETAGATAWAINPTTGTGFSLEITGATSVNILWAFHYNAYVNGRDFT